MMSSPDIETLAADGEAAALRGSTRRYARGIGPEHLCAYRKPQNSVALKTTDLLSGSTASLSGADLAWDRRRGSHAS
jgi:hypothetical protein